MSLRCREVRVADLPALFELRLSTRENAVTLEELEQGYGVTPASLAAALQDKVRGWLCEEAGVVLGFSLGDAASGEVLVVAVHPGHEGRGIGGQVLGRVAGWLFAEGHVEIWLRANPDPSIRAHGFYRRLGWRPSGERLGSDEVLRLKCG